MQTQIEFTSNSPINTLSLTGQNKKLYDYLMTGKSINCLHPAKIELGIGYLNSRISDLVKHNIPISKRYIKVNNSTVVEYSLLK